MGSLMKEYSDQQKIGNVHVVGTKELDIEVSFASDAELRSQEEK